MLKYMVVAGAIAASVSSAAAQERDVSGTWELSFDGRRVPAASLAPGVTPAMLEEVAQKDARSVRWCLPLGLPFTMTQSRPIDIRQGTRHIVISAESLVAPARYVYLNRAAHIDKEEFEPTTSGDSIARWEGDTLVVDTVGFSASKGMLSIPGGGYRTEDTRLTERFRLLQNGSILSVTSTWEDPKVFRVPHTYELRYQRLPANYEPRPALACDAYDADRVAFVEAGRPEASRRGRPSGRPAAGVFYEYLVSRSQIRQHPPAVEHGKPREQRHRAYQLE